MLLSDLIKPGKVIFRDRVFEPDEIRAGIDHLFRYLSDNIPKDKPFIYLISPNHVKFVIAYFAIIKSGHIVILVDPKIGRLEFEEMLEDTPPAAIIRVNSETVGFDYFSEIEFREGAATYTDELDDVCTMAYTAADDGYAKAAMLTNVNMHANAESIAEGNSVQRDSVSCAALPLSHLFGLQGGGIASFLSQGASLVIGDYLMEQRSLHHILARHAVTHLYSVPVVYRLLSRNPDLNRFLKSIQSMISGGCKLSYQTYLTYRDRFGLRLSEGYGLTEASPVCAWHFSDDTVRSGTVGRSISCCTIGISVNDQAVQHVGNGEICIKGRNVMKGYYGSPDFTRKVLRNGWLHTRDNGEITEKGTVTLFGNSKEMLNVSGNKLYLNQFRRHLQETCSCEGVKMVFRQLPDIGDCLEELQISSTERPYSGEELRNTLFRSFPSWQIPKRITIMHPDGRLTLV